MFPTAREFAILACTLTLVITGFYCAVFAVALYGSLLLGTMMSIGIVTLIVYFILKEEKRNAQDRRNRKEN